MFLLCDIPVAATMGLKQCVQGVFILVVFDHVYSARPVLRTFQPQTLMQEPQRLDTSLRERWQPLRASYGVESQRSPMGLNLAPSSIQSKQELQGPVRELTWKFPITPEEPTQPDINFELQQPRPSNSVAVQCLEDGIHVEVKQDFFGTGQLLEPSLFSLGGCGVVDVDAAAQILVFHSALQECGSQLMVTEDELVYLFTLDYRPAVLQSTPIVRSSAATVVAECHYPRRHNVSSNELWPSWIPHASTKVVEDILVFSMKLMTDDWMFERPSNIFFLGDIFNIQVSVRQYNHVHLRVFVDGCIATASPDVNSAPTYSFIENHGCLTDAKYTGSMSNFLPRVQDDKLEFQLESFRFQQGGSDIYITCLLKASAVSLSQIDDDHKACSFQKNGWVSADGLDQVCSCCDASCGLRTGFQWEGKAQVGPLQIWESNSPQVKTV